MIQIQFTSRCTHIIYVPKSLIKSYIQRFKTSYYKGCDGWKWLKDNGWHSTGFMYSNYSCFKYSGWCIPQTLGF